MRMCIAVGCSAWQFDLGTKLNKVGTCVVNVCLAIASSYQGKSFAFMCSLGTQFLYFGLCFWYVNSIFDWQLYGSYAL